jgi:hypothetical protein
MNEILVNHLSDFESGTIQHSGGSEGSLVKYETTVSLPNIRHRNHDYIMREDTGPLTVSNVAKVEGEERRANISNGYSEPEKHQFCS